METGSITALIESGRRLLDHTNFSTSRMDLWVVRSKRTLEDLYDDEIAYMFEHIINGSVVWSEGESQYGVYAPKIREAIAYLEALVENAEMPKSKEKPVQLAPSSQHFHVNGGNVQVGNGNTININDITVRDILNILENELTEKIPASSEKQNLLSNLKALTQNETIANIVGTTLGAFLGHLSH